MKAPIELPQIDRSQIEWTGASWNPWTGCTKVTSDCDNCYMFRDMKRYGKDPSTVKRSADATRNKPLKWQRECDAGKRVGHDRFVFTCSWSDWFIHDADPWRDEAWEIVRRCPGLVFQILTKRPGRIERNLPAFYDEISERCIFGTSCGHQRNIGMIRALRDQSVRRRFLSIEPMHGPVDLRPWLREGKIEQVIFGGESGPDTRPLNVQWILDGLAVCREFGVRVFVKQLGRNPYRLVNDEAMPLLLKDPKGGDWDEWPEELRVREWPEIAA